MMITVKCPRCGQEREVEAGAAGSVYRCECGQSYRVVGPSAPQPEPESYPIMRKFVLLVAVGIFLVWVTTGVRDVLSARLEDEGSPAPEALWQPTKTEVDLLIAKLSDDDPNRARSAGISLGRLGDSDEAVLERVLEVFRSREEGAVVGAGFALAGMGRPAVPALIAALEEDDAVTVGAAANALSAIGKEDPTAIVAAFDPLMEAHRRHAVAAMAPAAVAPLGRDMAEAERRKAETDRVEKEAKAAGATVRALGTLGEARGLETIIRALDHPHRTVGNAAFTAIEAFGPAATSALIGAWQRGQARGEWGVYALSATGDPEAIDLLIEALKTDTGWLAAQALGDIGDQRAGAALLGVLQDDAADRQVRAYAADSLGKLKYGPAVPALMAGLDDPEKSVQQAAAEALGAIGDGSAVKTLISALRSEDRATLASAATSLGQLGDARAVEPLLPLLDHREQRVRIAAIKALGELGDARAIGPLIDEMSDKESGRNSAVGAALVAIGPAAAGPLVKLLGHEERNVKREAASALGQMKGDAIDALVAGLDKAGSEQRAEIMRLLRAMDKDPRAKAAQEAQRREADR